ncbi:hypothetical protein J6590_037556 [Homalodisca vitripennis]|nr:hypothetical protein J6590_037556 [Homalodisca vitripennis]
MCAYNHSTVELSPDPGLIYHIYGGEEGRENLYDTIKLPTSRIQIPSQPEYDEIGQAKLKNKLQFPFKQRSNKTNVPELHSTTQRWVSNEQKMTHCLNYMLCKRIPHWVKFIILLLITLVIACGLVAQKEIYAYYHVSTAVLRVTFPAVPVFKSNYLSNK